MTAKRRRLSFSIAAMLLLMLLAALLLHEPTRESSAVSRIDSTSAPAESGDGGTPEAPSLAPTDQSAILDGPEFVNREARAPQDLSAPVNEPPAVVPVTDDIWLTGHVRDADGEPIEKARVALCVKVGHAPTLLGGGGNPYLTEEVEIDSDETKESGFYELLLGDRFPYVVVAEKDGHAAASATLFPGAIKVRTDANGRRFVEHDLTLGTSQTMSGRVIDTEGSAVADVRIVARIPIPTTQAFDAPALQLVRESGVDGRFEFDVPIGSKWLTLQLFKDGYAPVQHEMKLPVDERDFVISQFGGIIGGTVTHHDGNPAAGINISIYAGKPGNYMNDNPIHTQTKSDAQGAFEFRPVREGKWFVVATMSEQENLSITGTSVAEVNVGIEQIIDDVELVLPPMLIVRGTVHDEETSNPIAGARIYRSDTVARELDAVTTNEEGRFDLGALPVTEDQWRRVREYLKIEKTGYLSSKVKEADYWDYRKAPSAINDGVIEEEITLKPIHAVRLSGRVVDWNGAPAANIFVINNDQSHADSRTFTDARGQFAIPVMANRTIYLEARPPDSPITYSTAIAVHERDMQGIEMRLDPGGDLRVTVHTPDGDPLSAAQVTMMRRTRKENSSSASRMEFMTTDEKGTVLIDKLPSTDAPLKQDLKSASVDVEAHHADYDPVDQSGIRIEAGRTAEVTLTMLEKDRSAIYEGTVRDEEGNPIEGVTVQLQVFEQARTDALGFFHFEKFRPAEYYVRFDHPDYRTFGHSVQMPKLDEEIVMKKKAE